MIYQAIPDIDNRWKVQNVATKVVVIDRIKDRAQAIRIKNELIANKEKRAAAMEGGA